ncbi:MAG: hypothetical protein PHT12_01400 [Patescibacteria group bacterium]|nr:hypothetical protein [Patescibacteria group bacterium]
MNSVELNRETAPEGCGDCRCFLVCWVGPRVPESLKLGAIVYTAVFMREGMFMVADDCGNSVLGMYRRHHDGGGEGTHEVLFAYVEDPPPTTA